MWIVRYIWESELQGILELLFRTAYLLPVARIQKFWKGGGAEDNVSAPLSFIANAHNELYVFLQENAAY